MENYSLSDVAAVTDNRNGWGDNGCLWLILLFALMGGGFGFGNRCNTQQPVTEASLCNAMNFNNLENQVARMNDQQAQIARQTDNAICQIGYNEAQLANQTQRQLADCCCEMNRNIDNIRFDMANYSSAINANTNDGIQKILDKLCQDKTEALQQRIQQLEMANAMAGVVRYPMATTYATGCNPFFGASSNCCCNGNI